MIHCKRRTRWACLIILVAATLVVGPGGMASMRSDVAASSGSLLEASIEAQGLPPLTAPGSVVPLHWVTAGGAIVENTAVDWDTYSHQYDGAYRFRTAFQHKDAMGAFFDYINVPEGADAVYLRPWAIIDGERVDAPREYSVPTWRAVDAGGTVYREDAYGRWWTADDGYAHHWVGFEGGTSLFVNQPIGNADMEWMYQRQRAGVESMTCWLTEAVASMEIDVTLYLAELELMAAGQRVFDVVLEPGTPEEVVISNIDIAAQVGWFSALTISRTVIVRDYQLDVAFVPVVGEPTISGISLVGKQGYPQMEAAQRIAYQEHDTYVLGGSNNWAAERLYLGGSDYNHGGFLFFALQVPQGATINHAELSLTASDTSYHPVNLMIYAEDTDDSVGFHAGSTVPQRPRTSVGVPWNITETWSLGERVTSPDFAAAIQEVIDRPGWQAWNSMTILVIADTPPMAGGPPREVWAWEGDFDERAQLVIQYTPRDQTEPPTPAPTLTFTPTPSNTPTPTMTATPTNTATPTATPTRLVEMWLPMVLVQKP